MKFFENVAKKIFNKEGIKILEGHVAYSPEEAVAVCSEMGVPVVLKAQVLTGGRGKAGGVKFADNPGEALIKYIVDLKDEGTLIVDPGTTDIEDVRDFIDQHNIKVFNAPATKTANDEIGLKIVANIVMVGAITKITGVISENAAIEAIKDSVPAGTEEKNINAFEAGYNLV